MTILTNEQAKLFASIVKPKEVRDYCVSTYKKFNEFQFEENKKKREEGKKEDEKDKIAYR